MKRSITFGGLTTHTTDHEAHEGDCCASVNLIHEHEALLPLSIALDPIATLSPSNRLVGTHQGDGYCHLLLEEPVSDGWTYHWMDEHDGQPHLLTHCTCQIRAFTSTGALLTLVCEDGLRYALWEESQQTYTLFNRDDLLYDLHLTQDNQTACILTQDVSETTIQRLDAQEADAATLTKSFDQALSHRAALLGGGVHQQVVLGVAALRLHDGSHVLVSNLFALLPSDITDTITVDRENRILRTTAYLHRHFLTVTPRHPQQMPSSLIEGVDIFLSPPCPFLDTSRVAYYEKDESEHTISITLAHKGVNEVLQEVASMTFHKTMTISRHLWGTPILVPTTATSAEAIDLRQLHQLDQTAHDACSHQGRVTLWQTATLLHHPLEIGIRYRFAQRMAGEYIDTLLSPDGSADLVVHAITDDDEVKEVWWHASVPYPLPGMMMHCGTHVRETDWHLRLTDGDGYRYYTLRRHLQQLGDKDMMACAYSATGQVHHTSRPAVLSLLFQQVRHLDTDYDTTQPTEQYAIWQEETAADYERHASQVSKTWTIARDTTRLSSSRLSNPLVFPRESAVSLGDGKVLLLTGNTRRTADGLYGDGQYYAFTDRGLWLLRMSGGRWHAQQAVTRLGISHPRQVTCTADGVAFISERGVMLVKGSTATCLSDAIAGEAISFATLPHAADIVATEGGLPPTVIAYPDWKKDFLKKATIEYDSANDRLWFHVSSDDGAPSLEDHSSGDDNTLSPWPHILVYSLQSGAWCTLSATLSATMRAGQTVWGVTDTPQGREIGKIRFARGCRMPVVLCSRPLDFGQCGAKRVERLIVRGLFHDKGTDGSHIGVALYGSNDLHHWWLLQTSSSQYLRLYKGTPFRWWRVAAVGQLHTGESIEGAHVCFRNKK